MIGPTGTLYLRLKPLLIGGAERPRLVSRAVERSRRFGLEAFVGQRLRNPAANREPRQDNQGGA